MTFRSNVDGGEHALSCLYVPGILFGQGSAACFPEGNFLLVGAGIITAAGK